MKALLILLAVFCFVILLREKQMNWDGIFSQFLHQYNANACRSENGMAALLFGIPILLVSLLGKVQIEPFCYAGLIMLTVGAAANKEAGNYSKKDKLMFCISILGVVFGGIAVSFSAPVYIACILCLSMFAHGMFYQYRNGVSTIPEEYAGLRTGCFSLASMFPVIGYSYIRHDCSDAMFAFCVLLGVLGLAFVCLFGLDTYKEKN